MQFRLSAFDATYFALFKTQVRHTGHYYKAKRRKRRILGDALLNTDAPPHRSWSQAVRVRLFLQLMFS